MSLYGEGSCQPCHVLHSKVHKGQRWDDASTHWSCMIVEALVDGHMDRGEEAVLGGS